MHGSGGPSCPLVEYGSAISVLEKAKVLLVCIRTSTATRQWELCSPVGHF